MTLGVVQADLDQLESPNFFFTHFQMDIPTRVVRIYSLVQNKEYSILRAERVNNFGNMIMFSVRDSPDSVSQIFLPQSYKIIYTDEDLADINSYRTCYTLVYRGQTENLKFHILYIVKIILAMKCSLILLIKTCNGICLCLSFRKKTCS